MKRTCFAGCRWWIAKPIVRTPEEETAERASVTDQAAFFGYDASDAALPHSEVTCRHPEENWTVPAWNCPHWEPKA